MNLEQIKALNIEGLSDDNAKKIADASQEELKTYIPKTRFDEVNNTKKELEKQVQDRDKQIEDIKKNAGDNEELKKTIENLQADNKKKDEDYQAQIKDIKLTNAILLAIGDDAHDKDLVLSQVDKSKLILGDDDKVTGLDEQVKEIKANKPFLFKTPTPAPNEPPKPNIHFGAPQPKPNEGGQMSMRDAIAAKLQSQMNN